MEIPSHLAANLDGIKLAAFIAAFLINRQAAIIATFHIAGDVIFNTTDSGFYCSVMMACLYSINAAINIKISYQIRQALICIGCINWLAALDFYLSPNVTSFYLCYPWLINGLDVFILYLLLCNGGLQSVGTYRPWHRRLVNL